MPRLKLSKLFVALQVLFLLGCLAASARAQDDDQQERIRSFDSHIALSADGSMTVRETIDVIAAGDQIRHGIYRDFPTRYKARRGNYISVLFEIVSVERDGNPEPYHTEGIPDGVRVYFGDSGKFVSNGPHRYVFTYITNRQLGFFSDHDELYWNVTSTGWIFPIDRATATMVLPPQIHNFVKGMDAYVGASGERGRQFTATRDADGNPHFEAANLLSYQGLTIVVSWPTGLIAPPSREQKVKWFLKDNLATIVALCGLVIVLVYYTIVWIKVGRDPAAGTIVPQYEPPDNMSPAAMRYLKHMGFDDRCFTSAILGLAAKKRLTIDQSSSHVYRLIATTDSSQFKTQLARDEKTVEQNLFETKHEVSLDGTNASTINAAKKALSTALHTGMEKIYFVTNAGYLWPGIALTIASGIGMLISLAIQPQGSGQLFVGILLTIWLSGWSLGVGALLHAVARAWKSSGATVAGRASALGITLFSIPFLLGEIVGLGFLAWAVSIPACLMIIALIGSNVLFHHLLKAPTRAGRQLLDRIDGFKMFLTAVDGPRLNTVTPPGKTPELFERFLPYALALGVEQQWGEQFSQVLAASASGTSGHASAWSPSWYSGSFIASSPAAFASSFSGAFSSAVSASSSPPGSSSGGGGGGFSGGGGGGGGGGGW
ncbi:MAG TPA: DUF2207 domain-containing protein [Candidatus Angelobacter sp.]|nr:DUF2207 domain-containing protein [Candidatus Angelobacter sp.]